MTVQPIYLNNKTIKIKKITKLNNDNTINTIPKYVIRIPINIIIKKIPNNINIIILGNIVNGK